MYILKEKTSIWGREILIGPIYGDSIFLFIYTHTNSLAYTICKTVTGVWLTDKLLIYDNEELHIGFKESDCKLLDDLKRKRGPGDPGPSVEVTNKKRARDMRA